MNTNLGKKVDGFWWFVAALGSAVLVIGTLAMLSGCATPQYNSVPPGSPWTNGIPELKTSSITLLPGLGRLSALSTRFERNTGTNNVGVVTPENLIQPARGFVAFRYPVAYAPGQTNMGMPYDRYQWSLEETTVLSGAVAWRLVTNFPRGWTNDVWVTNDFVPGGKFYRMQGRL